VAYLESGNNRRASRSSQSAISPNSSGGKVRCAILVPPSAIQAVMPPLQSDSMPELISLSYRPWMTCHGFMEVRSRSVTPVGSSSSAAGNWQTARSVSLAPNSEKLAMTDDKTRRGQPDRDLINVNDDYELRNWSKSLNKTPDEIKGAVRVVGNSAAKVREYLSR